MPMIGVIDREYGDILGACCQSGVNDLIPQPLRVAEGRRGSWGITSHHCEKGFCSIDLLKIMANIVILGYNIMLLT